MPFGDGTGPLGMGPHTGRNSWYLKQNGMGRRNAGSWGKRGLLAGFAVPVVAAVLRDISNPYGFLRTISAKLSGKRILNTTARTIKDTEYTIMDGNDDITGTKRLKK
jgi:hypothetical protein